MIVVLGIVAGALAFAGAIAWLVWTCASDTPEPRERPRRTVGDALNARDDPTLGAVWDDPANDIYNDL